MSAQRVTQFDLTPSKQVKRAYDVVGFDVETFGDDNAFYCATFAGAGWTQTFFDKELCKLFIERDKRIKNGTIICATNLHFDFFALYDHMTDAVAQYRMLWRGSHLLTATTTKTRAGLDKRDPNKKRRIKWLDTMNYASISVEKLGKLIGKPKLTKPACLGRLPVSDDEREELVTYNVQDAIISREGLLYLFHAFEELGATPKMTLASTAMSLFRNRFLQETVKGETTVSIREQMNAYYGGRVEAFKRGTITGDYHLYDYNSLYPWAMLFEVPDPKTKRYMYGDDAYPLIHQREGYAHVDVHVPAMRYPPLPYRHESGRLLFPVGTMTGWWTHLELREALKRGCVIKRVRKVVYYNATLTPFKEYVETMYAKRKEYDAKKSPMGYVCKILMNALYGKFGQRFDARENIEPVNHTPEQLAKFDIYDMVYDADDVARWLRTKTSVTPAPFCRPIWASYITARARLRLLEGLEATNAVYCDTDSLLTTARLPDSSRLGELKNEFDARTCVIVRPKLYALTGVNKKEKVRAKGMRGDLRVSDFMGVIESGVFSKRRFLKLKEALRRNMSPNLAVIAEKHLSLEDTKRKWDAPFDASEEQDSEPLTLEAFELLAHREEHPEARTPPDS